MLPGFTGYLTETHHETISNNISNTGNLVKGNQGITLAGGSGPGGQCYPGCTPRKTKCVGTYQYWICNCNGQDVGGEYAYGDCFLWW